MYLSSKSFLILSIIEMSCTILMTIPKVLSSRKVFSIQPLLLSQRQSETCLERFLLKTILALNSFAVWTNPENNSIPSNQWIRWAQIEVFPQIFRARSSSASWSLQPLSRVEMTVPYFLSHLRLQRGWKSSIYQKASNLARECLNITLH